MDKRLLFLWLWCVACLCGGVVSAGEREVVNLNRERDLFLEFDGVFQEAEVYVNGTLAGTHRGGAGRL